MDARTSPLAQFKAAWAVPEADGPASRWPRLNPRPEIAQYCGDMQGMGVPAESLPMPLSCYSVNGWTLEADASGIRLAPGAPDPKTGASAPKNEEGCRRHLGINRDSATRTWLAWLALQKALKAMESSARTSPKKPETPKWKPKAPGSGRRWAQYA